MASSRTPTRIQLRWRVSAGDAATVADQVARQLELGYERIQPHRAEFLDFGADEP